jgi:nucleoside-diphosphate-sugar epimerase
VRVLLTGAGGFIGRHALDVLLEENHEVHAVCRDVRKLPREAIAHELDLLHPGAVETLARELQPTHLLHLAWYAVPGAFWSAPENERWIDASLRLLRAFGEAGGTRAVLAGTCAEYAWGEALLREQATGLEPATALESATPEMPATPLEPATLYGACKHATHIAAKAVAEQLNVSLAWGRVFFLYGPGEARGRLVGDVARALLAGEDFPTTDGRQLRDFMHVRDVASAFAQLLEADLCGPINIASGAPLAVGDLVRLIAAQTGDIERVRFGALERRPGEPDSIVADVARLGGELGFTPAIELQAGVADTVAWLRSER